jgi:flagellar basal-body rod protein FlgB
MALISRVMGWLIRRLKGLKISIICPPSVHQWLPSVWDQSKPLPPEHTMLEQMTGRLETLSSALQLRAQRQQVLASNIANVDTPGYVARDIDFNAALQNALTGQHAPGLAQTSAGHRTITSTQGLIGSPLAYTVQTQPSLDGNTVDLDQQRANFTDNAIRYESTLRFINGHVKTMLSAITGQ